MSIDEAKQTLAPCGLCCETCFAHVDGKIRAYSLKLQKELGNFHLNAKRLETLLDNPIFSKYAAFKELLDYFAQENCQGCRKQECPLFKDCGVRPCVQQKQLDFCYQCEEFPCDRTNFDPGLYKGWVKLNEKIREIGVEPFAEQSKQRPRYP